MRFLAVVRQHIRALAIWFWAAVLLLLLLLLVIGICRYRRRTPRSKFITRTHTLAYTYSATATVRSLQHTHLVFPAPPLPHRDDLRPTITRDFTEELSGSGYRVVKPEQPVVNLTRGRARPSRPRTSVLLIQQLNGPSSDAEIISSGNAASAERQNSPSPATSPASLSPPPLQGGQADQPVAGPSGQHHSLRPSSGRSTRSRSFSPSELSELSSDSEQAPPTAHSRPSFTEDVDYLVRYERCHPKSEIKVYWWETKAHDRILCPPDLSRRLDISEGDVYVHRYGTYLNNGGEHQDLWIWTSEGGSLHWKSIRQGYQRADGRVLALTESRKQPSWLDREWYLKRLAQDRL